MTNRVLVSGAALLLMAGSVRAADEIIVTVRDGSVDFGAETLLGTFDSGEAISLDTDDLVAAASNSLVFVRIYDVTSFNGGTPANTVGSVSINVVNGVRPAEIRILVAPPPNGFGENGYADYQFDPAIPLPFAGALSFTSLTINETAPGEGENPWLVRNRVRLALSTFGGDVGLANQNDRIEAGQIYRLQARAVTLPGGALQGGTIHADLNSYQNQGLFDSFLNNGFSPMAFVQAGNAIYGNITAWHDGDDTVGRFNPIGRIIVGPSLNAGGIFGDIESKRSGIESIFTTGPIGTGSSPTKIWAADGIEFIRARVENSVGEPLDRDINASIRASLDWSMPSGGEGGVFPQSDAQVHLIETGGDLTGEVRAANITFFPSNVTQCGILVRGDILAPITIDLNLENADIIARNILAPIVIGVKAKGAIVATDNEGWIESVEIGHTSNAEPDVLAIYRNNFPSALVGNDCPPVNDVDPATGLRVASPWLSGPLPGNFNCLDGGTRDSVIRADAIGTVNLRGMTKIFTATEGGIGLKLYAPRVEARMFGSLSVGDLREGVVWSGKLEYLSTGEVANNPANDFATFGSSPKFNCIGPGADIWITDFGDARVFETVFGEIHTDGMAPSETIRIGRDIGGTDPSNGLRVGFCECDRLVVPPRIACGYYGGALAPNEVSPRSTLQAEQGAVRLARLDSNGQPQGDVAALAGQVMVNALNLSGSNEGKWYGDAAVRTSSSTISTLSLYASQPNRAPYYERPSSTLGLGSVGLVPFNLHDTDCLPPNGTKGICEIDPYAPNNNKRTVVLRHYGPISEIAGSNPAVVIERQDWAFFCPTPPPPPPAPSCYFVPVWNDVTSCFNVSVAPTSSIAPSNVSGEREIWVWPKTTVNSLCPGETWSNRTYRIRPRLTTPGNGATTRVRSDQTLVTVDPPVVYWQYTISLECFDLNLSGAPDMNDVPVFLEQHADYNEDEVVDVQDLNLLVQTIVNGGE